MIEVEIKGPVARKEYEKLEKTLLKAGEEQYQGYHVTLAYSDRGYNNRELRLEYRTGAAAIYIHTGKPGLRKEIKTELALGAFSDAVHMLAELGYKKGMLTAHKVFNARYGGAVFSLYDPDGESLHYEASISVGDPTSAKEAKQKLEKLARNFKLPIWGAIDMLEFMRKLNSTANYLYDYDVEPQTYFTDKFGI